MSATSSGCRKAARSTTISPAAAAPISTRSIPSIGPSATAWKSSVPSPGAPAILLTNLVRPPHVSSPSLLSGEYHDRADPLCRAVELVFAQGGDRAPREGPALCAGTGAVHPGQGLQPQASGRR